MKTRHSRRGEVATVALLCVAVVGLAAFIFKPRRLDGESRRADAGKAATAEVVATVAAVDAATEAKGAAAAASLAQIGTAAASLPPSPAADFIGREVPLALGYLPAPDPAALLEAERRRLAVMSGQLEEARRLYAEAYKDADAAKARAERAEAERAAAIADRQTADAAISEAAAANLALRRRSALQWAGIALLAILAAVVWFSGVSPAKIGRALAAVRAGESPVAAFDRVLPEWIQARVNRAARLETQLLG